MDTTWSGQQRTGVATHWSGVGCNELKPPPLVAAGRASLSPPPRATQNPLIAHLVAIDISGDNSRGGIQGLTALQRQIQALVVVSTEGTPTPGLQSKSFRADVVKCYILEGCFAFACNNAANNTAHPLGIHPSTTRLPATPPPHPP